MKRNILLGLILVTLVVTGAAAVFAQPFKTRWHSPAPSRVGESSTSDQASSTATDAAGGVGASAKGATTSQDTADASIGKGAIPIRRTAAKPIPDSLGGPKSLSELVASANVIVIGQVTSLVDTQIFYGYDAGAAQRAEIDKANGSQRLGIPTADYAVTIDRILLSDGKIAQGGDLTLRVAGTLWCSPSVKTREGGRNPLRRRLSRSL